jgi:hypothetical protein
MNTLKINTPPPGFSRYGMAVEKSGYQILQQDCNLGFVQRRSRGASDHELRKPKANKDIRGSAERCFELGSDFINLSVDFSSCYRCRSKRDIPIFGDFGQLLKCRTCDPKSSFAKYLGFDKNALSFEQF